MQTRPSSSAPADQAADQHALGLVALASSGQRVGGPPVQPSSNSSTCTARPLASRWRAATRPSPPLLPGPAHTQTLLRVRRQAPSARRASARPAASIKRLRRSGGKRRLLDPSRRRCIVQRPRAIAGSDACRRWAHAAIVAVRLRAVLRRSAQPVDGEAARVYARVPSRERLREHACRAAGQRPAVVAMAQVQPHAGGTAGAQHRAGRRAAPAGRPSSVAPSATARRRGTSGRAHGAAGAAGPGPRSARGHRRFRQCRPRAHVAPCV